MPINCVQKCEVARSQNGTGHIQTNLVCGPMENGRKQMSPSIWNKHRDRIKHQLEKINFQWSGSKHTLTKVQWPKMRNKENYHIIKWHKCVPHNWLFILSSRLNPWQSLQNASLHSQQQMSQGKKKLSIFVQVVNFQAIFKQSTSLILWD